MRIPMLEVILALGHFYLSDGEKKVCFQTDSAIYKLHSFCWEKYVKSL